MIRPSSATEKWWFQVREILDLGFSRTCSCYSKETKGSKPGTPLELVVMDEDTEKSALGRRKLELARLPSFPPNVKSNTAIPTSSHRAPPESSRLSWWNIILCVDLILVHAAVAWLVIRPKVAASSVLRTTSRLISSIP